MNEYDSNRIYDLTKKINYNKTKNIDEADYLICTGLFDEHEKELSYYKTLLKKMI